VYFKGGEMKGPQTILFATVLALAIGAELVLLSGEHPGLPWWYHVPGFAALFGFFVCLGLAFIAKSVGKRWLQRDENYYRRGRASRE
jgi:hypothetical protein